MTSTSAKRKHAASFNAMTKKPRLDQPPPQTPSVAASPNLSGPSGPSESSGPFESPPEASLSISITGFDMFIFEEKYICLRLSVISSTRLHTRITHALRHLQDTTYDTTADGMRRNRQRIVIFNARPENVGKMISIAEKTKSLLVEQKLSWFQYNMLRTSEEKQPKVAAQANPKIAHVSVIEDTVFPNGPTQTRDDKGHADEEEEEEYFETKRKFAIAADPPKVQRVTKTLCIILSIRSIPEFLDVPFISVQTSADVEA